MISERTLLCFHSGADRLAHAQTGVRRGIFVADHRTQMSDLANSSRFLASLVGLMITMDIWMGL